MNGTTTETDDGSGLLGSSQSRVYAIYVVWVVILVVSVAAGSYTLGFLVDIESIGSAEDPNSFQAVDEWAGFTVTNDDGGTVDGDSGVASADGRIANDDGGLANDDGGLANDDGMANAQSDLRSGSVFACDVNAFCPRHGR